MIYYKKANKQEENKQHNLSEIVSKVILDVKQRKDEAIKEYNIKFDNNHNELFKVSSDEIKDAYNYVDKQLIEDIKYAAKNIERFAYKQKETIIEFNDFEVSKSVFLGQKTIPVNSCGAYVPGGSYPLFSTALMLVIPAKVAGVKKVVACSPVNKKTNKIDYITLVALDIAGVDEVYAVGGIQAIAAMSYGSKQIPKVDIIVGPGNQYVSEAKKQCYGEVGIDFIAGPSEVLIIADEKANASYIAADILAQSEHDLLASGILITNSIDLADQVVIEINKQLEVLSTRHIASIAWQNNGEIIIVDDILDSIDIANEYAAEHLEVQVSKDIEQTIVDGLSNYGSLFIGENAAEVFGDYVVGTNHTLPTSKVARYTGGLYVGTFLKVVTKQYIKEDGLQKVASSAMRMAENEGLMGHAYAAKVRMK